MATILIFGIALGLAAVAVLEIVGVLPGTIMAWLVAVATIAWISAALWCGLCDWSYKRKSNAAQHRR
jgi:hypothetical protein